MIITLGIRIDLIESGFNYHAVKVDQQTQQKKKTKNRLDTIKLYFKRRYSLNE